MNIIGIFALLELAIALAAVIAVPIIVVVVVIRRRQDIKRRGI